MGVFKKGDSSGGVGYIGGDGSGGIARGREGSTRGEDLAGKGNEEGVAEMEDEVEEKK